MPEDPLLLSWFRQYNTALIDFARKLQRVSEPALQQAGITHQELELLQRELPRLTGLASAALTEPIEDALAVASVTRRLRAKIGPPSPSGCERWLGGVQGQRRDGTGGTPVIGYKGGTTPARRLLWQLRFRGTDHELAPDERLRNLGCHTGSLCMALAHWHKKQPRPALGAVRETLESLPPPPTPGRTCRNGHYIPRSAASCPRCRVVATAQRARQADAAFWAGRALRKALAAATGHQEAPA